MFQLWINYKWAMFPRVKFWRLRFMGICCESFQICTVPQVYIDTRNGHWTNIKHPQAIMLIMVDLGPWTGLTLRGSYYFRDPFLTSQVCCRWFFGMVCSSEVLILLTVSHSVRIPSYNRNWDGLKWEFRAFFEIGDTGDTHEVDGFYVLLFCYAYWSGLQTKSNKSPQKGTWITIRGTVIVVN